MAKDKEVIEKSPEERLSYLERLLQFIIEKTGLHFNMDEFNALENERAENNDAEDDPMPVRKRFEKEDDFNARMDAWKERNE